MCPGEFGHGSLNVRLGKYQPGKSVLRLEQGNGG